MANVHLPFGCAKPVDRLKVRLCDRASGDMSDLPASPRAAEEALRGLAAMSRISLDKGDAEEILAVAAGAVPTLGPCRVEASYRAADGVFIGCPSSQTERPDIEWRIGKQGCDRSLTMRAGRWGWAFGLPHRDTIQGCLVVSAAENPGETQFLLLSVLARQTGAALAYASMERDAARSIAQASRALKSRLLSAAPDAFDKLGFYRVIDAAHTGGTVEQFMRQWLSALMEYDDNKHSDLVRTLSRYLECGGNYDDTAAALHIHRSTLRYRLTRIRQLTGADLRNVDTRFNLHAATRAWRYLDPEGNAGHALGR
jgi:hypothetical protein